MVDAVSAESVEIVSRPVGQSGGGNKVDSSKFALVWKNLRLTVKRADKVLLKDVTGQITSGYYAIMGPSGSGKTTLLNSLSCRLDKAVVRTGDLRMNGKPYAQRELKQVSGFVQQDDLLVGSMTVQETLDFTAKLRLPTSYTHEQRAQRVEEVLAAMEIAHTRDTIIGDAFRKGISGGQRKRVCVAQELLSAPLLLFLDEPTSGLDSVTALSLCTKLRAMADAKTCTVVSTIHQPQAKIFFLFTDLLLLRAGNILYQGSAPAVCSYFAAIGQPVPLHENPADHVMDVMAIDSVAETLLKVYKAPDVDINLGSDVQILPEVPRQVPWGAQFAAVLDRGLKDLWRNRHMLYMQLAQTCIIAIFYGLTFLRIGTSNASQIRRRRMIFFAVINQGIFGSMTSIIAFPVERALVLRERASGMYRASAYFTAKVVSDLIGQILSPWLFTCIAYFMVGLNPLASKFFIFGAFLTLSNMCAVSLALAISAIGRTTDMACTLLPMALEVCRLFGAYFLPPIQLPKYFEWLDAMSYVKYAQTALTINEHTGLKYSDYNPDRKVGRPLRVGEDILVQQGFWNPKDGYGLTIGDCAGCMIAYIVIMRVIAYLGVRYIKW